jgi:hypothetical protein
MTRSIAARTVSNPPVEQSQLPLLLTENAAARFLGVSLPYLRRARSEGTTGRKTPAPPFVRVEGRIFYRRSDLEVWVDSLAPREVV